MRNRLSFWEI